MNTVEVVAICEVAIACPDDAEVPTLPAELEVLIEQLTAITTAETLPKVIVYLVRLPRYYAALLGRNLYRRFGSQFSSDKNWAAWFVANKKIFEDRGMGPQTESDFAAFLEERKAKGFE